MAFNTWNDNDLGYRSSKQSHFFTQFSISSRYLVSEVCYEKKHF